MWAKTSGVKILTLCTANVARSVMLAYMLSALGEAEGRHWELRSAGTHAREDFAMSARTRSALEGISDLDGLGERHYGLHRTHQVTAPDVAWADIVLAMEADHVRYLERLNEPLAARTVSFGQFVRTAPLDTDLADQIAVVRAQGLDDDCDVDDPGDGDDARYAQCALELWSMAQAFCVVVADDAPA